MVSILLVAHSPLATSLQALAGHAFAECSGQVAAVDIEPSASVEQAEVQIVAALAALTESGAEVLVLVDTFGATPCNAAVNVVNGSKARVVAGVNVPMLWRALCYRSLPLSELVARAVEGGRQGIMQLAAKRRQNHDNGPASDDAI